MRQNFYVKINSLGQIMDISDTQKPSYIPVAVDLSHLDLFKTKDHHVTYNTKLQALQYAPIINAYGVYWDGSANSQLKRIGESQGLKAGVGGARNDFDYKEPWSGIHQVEDSLGNQFMSIPPFYVKRTQNPNTGAGKLLISPTPVKGWYVPRCFINPSDNSIHDVWVGKYLDGNDGHAQATSKSGQLIATDKVDENQYPLNLLTYDDSRKHCIANNPNGSQSGPYAQLDIFLQSALQDLFIVEFATLDSKSVFINPSDFSQVSINNAIHTVPDGNNYNNNEEDNVLLSGSNDSLPGSSNFDKNEGIFCYRGIEGIFGISTWCDGYNPYNKSLGLDYTKYNDNGTGYVPLSYGDQFQFGLGIASRMGLDPRYPDIRLAVQRVPFKGNNANYYCQPTVPPSTSLNSNNPSNTFAVGGGASLTFGDNVVYASSPASGLFDARSHCSLRSSLAAYDHADRGDDIAFGSRLVYHPFG